jgi:hypothetical protein
MILADSEASKLSLGASCEQVLFPILFLSYDCPPIAIWSRRRIGRHRCTLCSFMAAEYDDLPEAVKQEVQTFADVNVAWLSRVLSAAAVVSAEESEQRARAIFAAVAGAQLIARSRSDISLFDALIDSYRVAGLLPA